MDIVEQHGLFLGLLAIAIGVGIGKALEVWQRRRRGRPVRPGAGGS